MEFVGREWEDTLKHLSLRWFEKMLGIAPTERSSGRVNQKKIAGGGSLCRKALWRWVYTRVETVKFKLSKNIRISNPVALDLYLWMNHADRQKKPIEILRMKVAKITRLLFDELLDELGGRYSALEGRQPMPLPSRGVSSTLSPKGSICLLGFIVIKNLLRLKCKLAATITENAVSL
jgi:hypothetical protein